MFKDILCFIFAITGVIFILYTLLYKLLLWGEKGRIVVVPVFPGDCAAGGGLRNTMRLLEFTGLKKHCMVIALDCGADEEELEAIKNQYTYDERFFICGVKSAGDLCELLGRRELNRGD